MFGRMFSFPSRISAVHGRNHGWTCIHFFSIKKHDDDADDDVDANNTITRRTSNFISRMYTYESWVQVIFHQFNLLVCRNVM